MISGWIRVMRRSEFKIGETVHEPKGCERCGGIGYRGRVGVFEVLEMTNDVRRPDSYEFRFNDHRQRGRSMPA